MADLRAERTRGYLREALMALLKETPIEGVTVSAVAKRAGVSRNSFYNHYSDLFALAEDCYMQELTYFSGSFKRRRDYANRREACRELLDETAHLLSFFVENPNFARMYLDNLCTSQYFAGCRSTSCNLRRFSDCITKRPPRGAACRLWWRRGGSNSGPYYLLREALQA